MEENKNGQQLTDDAGANNSALNEKKPRTRKPRQPRKPRKQALVVEDALIPNNTITVRLVQDTVKSVTKTVDGEKVKVDKPVKHHMEFHDETTDAMTNEDVSNYIVGSLGKYQLLQKAQGKAAFDTSLPIDLSIVVTSQKGDKLAVSGIKMSTNVKALARILDNYPVVVLNAFNPTAIRIGTSRTDILRMLDGSTRIEIVPAVTTQMQANIEAAKQLLLNGADVHDGQAVATTLANAK